MFMTIANALGVSKLVVQIGLITLILGGLGIAKCSYERSIVAAHDAEIESRILNVDVVAKEQAAIQRADDTAIITKAEKERNDEIRKATDSQPSAARNKLNCERLRKAGTDTSGLPACR